MNIEKRRKIFSLLKQNNPNPSTELNYNSSFELLIAVILSAQATDISVNKATVQLFKIANTAEKISSLSIPKIESLIKNIGLFHTKAKNIHKTSKIINQEYSGEIPRSRESLENLPGVGRKTANVILNTIFKEPVIAVDTHIFRLSNRIKLAPGNTPLAVEIKLTKLIPNEFLVDAHHLLILHGRYICKARSPDCIKCVIKELCEYKSKTLLN
ncbi:endonuclease III [Methylophilaceae bacterium]|jgi:endonuclease III|nr:endonuclease III [Methylophilaceae bacterium]|tara:strand:+ start:5405 stop:6043 length:639 start_codon:yes stop_codon:yes gene_type:complete